MADEQWLINEINAPIDDPEFSKLMGYAVEFLFMLGVYGPVTIRRRFMAPKTPMWVVINRSEIWNKNTKEFEEDWLPSWRTAEFDKNTMMTFVEAFQTIQFIRERMIKNKEKLKEELERIRKNKQ
jgi:hypothetical protein